MTTTEPSTRRQERARATREQLLAAAREVFEEKGFRGTTVGAITERASTAHGTFYLYFKNKEDAFAKVFAEAVQELAAESEAPWKGDAKSSLRDALLGYFLVIQRHKGLWRCLMEGLYASPAVQAVWLDLRRPFVERLTEMLTAQGQAGVARAADPEALAVVLGSMVEWTAYTVVELEEPAELGLERAVDALTDLWFAGVYERRAG